MSTCHDEAIRARLREIEQYGAYQLVGRGECASPDSKSSPGAGVLVHVAQNLVEAIEIGPGAEWTTDALREAIEGVRDGYAGVEIADGAPSVYTHQMMLEAVDLAAYQEDVSEYGPVETAEQAMRVGVYLIAARLVSALLEELEELADELDSDEEA